MTVKTPAVFDPFETDGTFVWIRESGGKLLNYAIREGTSLKVQGKTVVDSEIPTIEVIKLEN